MGLFDSIGSALGIGGSASYGTDNTNYQGTKTVARQFDQKAIDKVIYDIMASDQGLSALASAENASGGAKSSSKTLLAQDLIAKVAGTIAQLTAPEVTSTQGSSDNTKRSTSVKTVICTYLAEQGYLPLPLYLKGTYHTLCLSENVMRGYHLWAIPVVSLLKKYPFLCPLITPIVRSRYEYIVNNKLALMGRATVFIGQPICALIGMMIPKQKEYAHG
jgi:hypothetical protein